MERAQQNPLEQALQAQQATLQDLSNRRHSLSDGLAKSVLEALEVWLVLAQTPGHPAQLAARELLVRWGQVLKGAQAVAGGIQVVQSGPGSGNGRI